MYKVVFFGDAECGKTTLIKRLRGLPFETKYLATIGVVVHPIIVGNNCISAWDCAGQEKFKGLAGGCYVNADLGVIVLDYESFSGAAYRALKYTSEFREVSGAPLMMIAIRKSDKPINTDDYKLVNYIISAKDNVEFIKYEILSKLGVELEDVSGETCDHQTLAEITEKLANEVAKNNRLKELVKKFFNDYIDEC
jgi:small GTP-binding protein